ncbi:MAG: hypothetical protein IKD69_15225 [Solobacterium sp.]|nr:hypothetical protein [Solobacterium sp.]
MTEAEAVEDASDNLKAHLEFLPEDGESLPTISTFDEGYCCEQPFLTNKSMHRRIRTTAERKAINEAVIE